MDKTLQDVNTGFQQDEYDALGDWEQRMYVRDFGRRSGQDIVRGYGDMTRAAEERMRGLDRTADLGRGLITRGAGESWRQGIGSVGAGPVGGGSIAAMAGIGAQGGAQRAAFESAMADRMAEANIAAADARAQEAGARANYAMMLSQMGTELQYTNAEWDATEGMRNNLLKNFGNDKGGLGRAFISQAKGYPVGHPMRERWIQAAFDQGKDRAVADALRDNGMPEFDNMTAYGMPAGYEDQQAYESGTFATAQAQGGGRDEDEGEEEGGIFSDFYDSLAG